MPIFRPPDVKLPIDEFECWKHQQLWYMLPMPLVADWAATRDIDGGIEMINRNYTALDPMFDPERDGHESVPKRNMYTLFV